ncbi:hypothetical protein PVK06_030728 [Gossypium arboreum]|uniref:Uncharacterized protein n=1 Tax=Gossypium arboreum TaxID=29729 RepID=A0ABR0NP23_GOSAR|nr:hypothetical protein PVK06_030728 [Gossypium arboreum]
MRARLHIYPGTSLLHTEKSQSYGSKAGKIGTNVERNAGAAVSTDARATGQDSVGYERSDARITEGHDESVNSVVARRARKREEPYDQPRGR